MRTRATLILCLLAAEGCVRAAVAYDPRIASLDSFFPKNLRRGALILRGGEDRDGKMELDGVNADPRSWTEENVLGFLEDMRDTLKEKTDTYKDSFRENNIDGLVMLKLDSAKLESVGVKSLGHREHILDNIQLIRGKAGMAAGPTKSQFEAARAAEMAPPKHPPKMISNTAKKSDAPREVWDSVEKFAWDQEKDTVEVFVFLDDVGDLPKDNVSVTIGEWSIEVRAKGLNGKNYICVIDKLFAPIQTEQSFWKVKKGSVNFKLRKTKEEMWLSLRFDAKHKEREARMAKNKGEPNLMELMQDLYEDGDDVTKQTMAKAWSQAQQKMAQKDDSFQRMPDMPLR